MAQALRVVRVEGDPGPAADVPDRPVRQGSLRETRRLRPGEPHVSRDAKPRLAQFDQGRGERTVFGEQRAQVDVPDERKRRVSSDRGGRHSGQFHEPFLHGALQVRESTGAAEGSKTLFRDVTQKVADIEGRIALAVEVEVEQEKALAVHDDLVGVEVPVDPAERRLRRRRTEPRARVEDALDAPRPPRFQPRHGRQAFVQDAQFVGHRVAPWGRDPRSVDLARRLRDLPGQRDTCGRRQEVGRKTAGDLALEPHLECRDSAGWLRD